MRLLLIGCLGFLVLLAAMPSASGEGSEDLLVRRFTLPASPLEIRQAAKAGRFFDTMARRAGVLGTEGEGFEAWAYPLKLFHDCRIRVAVRDTDEIVDLGSRTDLVLVRPESTTLISTHSLFTIRQIFFTPLDRPGTVVLLDIDTARPLTLSVSFVPDLKPMWPAGLGGQYASWDEERRIFVISESRRKYNGLVGCPAAARGSTTPAHELGKGSVTFDINVDPQTARRFLYPIVIAGGQTGREVALKEYDALLRRIPEEYQRSADHFRSLRENLLSVETPEEELNLALEWAKIALDKGVVTNPDLGTGLIAGWGPSGESARPGFGWFFGGDTYLNQYAISGYGAFDVMREAFRFLQKRQRADGKMMHELTQSAGWLRWFEDYPYGYYHGDTTPFYITSFYDYYRQSGDRDLLHESWESLKRAYTYCKSTDEDGDGLMDNTKAGLGASELGALLEGLRTDILLGALSPAAWRAMGTMAATMGDVEIREEAQLLFVKALRSANERFWNPQLQSFVHALTKSGGQNPEITAWPALGIMLGTLRGARADATAERMASSALAVDWGTRMLANTSKAYSPAAYNDGAVWPFLTGLVAAAEFECHRSFSGYQLVMANARLTWAGALGAHPELLSGDYYRPLETAVPHQLFSSGGVVTPLVHGLLGLQGDAPNETVSFAPHFPPWWNHVRILRYRVGSRTFDITFERSVGRQRYIVEASAPGYRLNLSPALGLLASMRTVTVNGQNVRFKTEAGGDQDLHCSVAMELGRHTEISLDYEAGIQIDAPLTSPLPGDTSRGLKILSTHGDGSRFTALLEGLAGETYRLRAWTPLRLEGVTGGTVVDPESKIIEVSFPASNERTFAGRTLEIRLKKQ